MGWSYRGLAERLLSGSDYYTLFSTHSPNPSRTTSWATFSPVHTWTGESAGGVNGPSGE